MTLKDLFMQVRFDDLIPSLLEQDENTQNSICSFREAFDLLRMMEPDQDFKGEVVIQWSKAEEGEEPWIKVCHLDNEWEKQLAKEDINIFTSMISLDKNLFNTEHKEYVIVKPVNIIENQDIFMTIVKKFGVTDLLSDNSKNFVSDWEKIYNKRK